MDLTFASVVVAVQKNSNFFQTFKIHKKKYHNMLDARNV